MVGSRSTLKFTMIDLMITCSLSFLSYPCIFFRVSILKTSDLIERNLLAIMALFFKMESVSVSARSFLKVCIKSFIGLLPLLCIVPQLYCCDWTELLDHFKINRCKNQGIYTQVLWLYWAVNSVHCNYLNLLWMELKMVRIIINQESNKRLASPCSFMN